MKVSVCIPAYNRPEFLRVAIQSVLGQTFTDFELLIVDDASPINLEPIVLEFSDSRIRYERNETNLNYVKNWNRCIDLARGEYIKFLLDDDTFEPTILEKQVAILNQNSDVGFVGCRYQVIGNDGKIRTDDSVHSEQYRLYTCDTQESGVDFIKHFLLGSRAVGLPTSIMFRKSILPSKGFNPDADFAADIDMWCTLALKSDFFYIDQDLCTVRLHSGTISQSVTAKNAFNYRCLYGVINRLFSQMDTIQLSKLEPYRQKVFWRISHLAIVNAFRDASPEQRSTILSDIQTNDPFPINRMRANFLWTIVENGRKIKRLFNLSTA